MYILYLLSKYLSISCCSECFFLIQKTKNDFRATHSTQNFTNHTHAKAYANRNYHSFAYRTHTHTHDLYVPTDQTFYGHINVAVSLLQGPNIRALVVKSHIPQRLELNRVAFGGALVATTPSLYIVACPRVTIRILPRRIIHHLRERMPTAEQGVASVG